MNKNISNSKTQTNSSSTLSSSSSKQNQKKIYKIGIQMISSQCKKNKTPQMIYLNLKLKGQEERTIQTPCLDVISEKKHFMIKTQVDIEKIQVINYDSMKKLSKISLKGINKQFSYTHTQEKNSLKISIQMSYDKVDIVEKKNKLVGSVIYQEKEYSQLDTQESETQIVC